MAAIPQLRDNSQALSAKIEEQLANSTVVKYEILTESQAMMSDLEEDIASLQDRQAKVDSAVKRNEENLRKMEILIQHDKDLSTDLDTQIQAKLVAVHSLRERGVKLPPKEESNA